jgi:hypothetical protein
MLSKTLFTGFGKKIFFSVCFQDQHLRILKENSVTVESLIGHMKLRKTWIEFPPDHHQVEEEKNKETHSLLFFLDE